MTFHAALGCNADALEKDGNNANANTVRKGSASIEQKER